MRSLTLFLILTLAGLQYKLWLGDGGFKALERVGEDLKAEEEMNEKLAKRNRSIEADIEELKSGEQAVEEQARYELGMVKKGEIYYQSVD